MFDFTDGAYSSSSVVGGDTGGAVVPFSGLSAAVIKRVLSNSQHIGQFMGIPLEETVIDDVRYLRYRLPEADDDVGCRRVVEGAQKYVSLLSSVSPMDQEAVLRVADCFSRAAVSLVLTAAIGPKYIGNIGEMTAILKEAGSINRHSKLDVVSLYRRCIGVIKMPTAEETKEFQAAFRKMGTKIEGLTQVWWDKELGQDGFAQEWWEKKRTLKQFKKEWRAVVEQKLYVARTEWMRSEMNAYHENSPPPPKPIFHDAKDLPQAVLESGGWPRHILGHIPLARLQS